MVFDTEISTLIELAEVLNLSDSVQVKMASQSADNGSAKDEQTETDIGDNWIDVEVDYDWVRALQPYQFPSYSVFQQTVTIISATLRGTRIVIVISLNGVHYTCQLVGCIMRLSESLSRCGVEVANAIDTTAVAIRDTLQ